MRTKSVIILLGLFIFGSCNKKKFFDGPNFFNDGFETYSSLSDLLLPDDQLWSFSQLTRSENSITIDAIKVHSGNKSIKFQAIKSAEDKLSKCSISKQNMAFWEGETVRLSAWYFIEGTSSLDWLFLMDIEEQAAIGAGPGMRLALVDNKLRVEHKYNEKDITQLSGQEVDFPRNQWVEIVWEIKLSQKNKGSVKLWQNGQLILDTKNNRTLPKDLLYFQQGTKGMYQSCEIGITANSYNNDLLMWMDDIKFQKLD
jgi:Polysaccharide lyase